METPKNKLARTFSLLKAAHIQQEEHKVEPVNDLIIDSAVNYVFKDDVKPIPKVERNTKQTKKKTKNLEKANLEYKSRIRETNEKLLSKVPIKLEVEQPTIIEKESVELKYFYICCMCGKKIEERCITVKCGRGCVNEFHAKCWSEILSGNGAKCCRLMCDEYIINSYEEDTKEIDYEIVVISPEVKFSRVEAQPVVVEEKITQPLQKKLPENCNVTLECVDTSIEKYVKMSLDHKVLLEVKESKLNERKKEKIERYNKQHEGEEHIILATNKNIPETPKRRNQPKRKRKEKSSVPKVKSNGLEYGSVAWNTLVKGPLLENLSIVLTPSDVEVLEGPISHSSFESFELKKESLEKMLPPSIDIATDKSVPDVVKINSLLENSMTDSPRENVLTGSPSENVLTGSPLENVLTGSPRENVLTGSPTENVLTDSLLENVVTGSLLEDVVTQPKETSSGTCIDQLLSVLPNENMKVLQRSITSASETIKTIEETNNIAYHPTDTLNIRIVKTTNLPVCSPSVVKLCVDCNYNIANVLNLPCKHITHCPICVEETRMCPECYGSIAKVRYLG